MPKKIQSNDPNDFLETVAIACGIMFLVCFGIGLADVVQFLLYMVKK